MTDLNPEQPRLEMIVTGTRDWPDAVAVFEGLDEVAHQYRVHVLHASYAPIMVIHGDSGNVDKWAEAWAQLNGHDRDPHPARWRQDGLFNSRAGRERNVRMFKAHPHVHVVAAFWDGKSTGTAHCMGEAKRRGVPVEQPAKVAMADG